MKAHSECGLTVPEVGLETPCTSRTKRSSCQVPGNGVRHHRKRARHRFRKDSVPQLSLEFVEECVHLGCSLAFDHAGPCVTADGQQWLLDVAAGGGIELGWQAFQEATP